MMRIFPTRSWRQAAAWGGFLALGAALFWPTMVWMAQRFEAPDSLYTHGWLIPLASGWLIWQRRQLLSACVIRASFTGLWVLLPALLLLVVATWWQVGFLAGLALVGTIGGLVWTCWGGQVLRIVRFPLAFLLFMVPVPGVLLIAMSFKMKLLAASAATGCLRLLGLAATQSGSTITVPGLSVLVDDTCSGLRSLISLIALAAFWTAMMPSHARRWHKMTIVFAAIPIALVANIIRIVGTVLLGLIYGPRAAEGFVHYSSGLVVFGIALVALGGLSRLLVRPCAAAGFVGPPAPALLGASPAIRPGGLWRPSLAAFLLLLVGAGLIWAGKPSLQHASGAQRAPETLGLWVGSPLTVEPRVFEVLETNDVAAMEYHLGKEPPVWLSQVAGLGTRAAFHPPELCYVGSNFEVLERGPITILVNGQPRRLMRLVIGQDGQRYEAWYWFTASDRVTPSYYQQQAWLLLDAVRRKPMSGTLVRVSTPLDGELPAHRRLLAFVTAWDPSSRRLPPRQGT